MRFSRIPPNSNDSLVYYTPSDQTLSDQQGMKNPWELNGLACDYIKNSTNKNKEAVNIFTLLHEKNNPSGTNNLGLCYYMGIGVPKDFKKAFSLFKQAVERGDKIALGNLGKCYSEGIGVGKNYKEAVRLYELIDIPENKQDEEYFKEKLVKLYISKDFISPPFQTPETSSILDPAPNNKSKLSHIKKDIENQYHMLTTALSLLIGSPTDISGLIVLYLLPETWAYPPLPGNHLLTSNGIFNNKNIIPSIPFKKDEANKKTIQSL